MATANIAEVVKLAAKPVRYESDEKTWLEFRFKLENYLTLVDERYVALLLWTRSLKQWRTFQHEHPNVESHVVRFVGDTDRWTKLEAGAKSAEQERVRGMETDGGRERAEHCRLEIRDAASRATAGDERQFGKV